MDDPRGAPQDDGSRVSASLIGGFHDVRVPVTDPWASRDWYQAVLAFDAVLDVEEAEGLVGVVMRHPSGVVLGLHRDPVRAAALRGYVLLALTVRDRSALEEMDALLDRLGVPHSSPEEGHLGWHLDVPDRDGIVIRLHTAPVVDTDEA